MDEQQEQRQELRQQQSRKRSSTFGFSPNPGSIATAQPDVDTEHESNELHTFEGPLHNRDPRRSQGLLGVNQCTGGDTLEWDALHALSMRKNEVAHLGWPTAADAVTSSLPWDVQLTSTAAEDSTAALRANLSTFPGGKLWNETRHQHLTRDLGSVSALNLQSGQSQFSQAVLPAFAPHRNSVNSALPATQPQVKCRET